VLDSAAFYLVLLCYWVPTGAGRARSRVGPARAALAPVVLRGGVLVLVVAFSPQLGRLSDQLLVAHMVEHLLIGDVAALLIVLGLTGPVLAPLLRIGWVSRLRVLAHPLVALRCGH